MKRKYLYRSLMAAICAGALMLPIGGTRAQTTIPPSPDLESHAHKSVHLDRESKSVADEYADVLRELRMTIGDYRAYLEESESQTIKQYLATLDKFTADLDKGTYIAKRDRLGSDLDRQIDEADKVQTYIRDSKEVFPVKTYKIVRSLNRDLTNMRDLLESDIIDQLDELKVSEADLQAYLKEALGDLETSQRKLAQSQAHIQREAVEAQTEAAEAQAEAIREQAEKDAEMAARAAVRAHPPTPPEVHVVIPEIRIRVPRQGNTGNLTEDFEGPGTTREMNGSISVTSTKIPVRIANRLGTVTVKGSSSNQVTAHWSLEFHSNSRQAEKDFLSGANLTVTHAPDRYDVLVELPDIDNKDTRILSSELVVTVPAANPLVIENSFGEVSVDGVQNGVDLTASYGNIELEDIKGGATVASSMGEVNMVNVTGPMNLRNAYAPITLEKCSGDFEIENAYGTIEVTGCHGNGTIKNSGTIEVSNHTGALDIKNSFGSVEVEGLTGDLEIENQFQPVVVRNIKGAVKLKNANSEIDVANIGGSLSANNTFGLIQAEDLAGPIKMVNRNGNIALVLGAQFKGNSTVRTSFGNIDVTIPETANMMVRARTTFGDIKSYLPMKVDELGQSKTGALKLGHGSDSLSIVAENSTITINGK